MRVCLACGLLLCLLLGCVDSAKHRPSAANNPSSDKITDNEIAPTITSEKPKPPADADPVPAGLTPVDLAPYQYFLTMDLPREVTVERSSDWGNKFNIVWEDDITVIDFIDFSKDPNQEKSFDDQLDELRKPDGNFKSIIDTPQCVVSGVPGAYLLAVKVTVGDKKYAFTNSVIIDKKSTALQIVASAKTLRQTDANKKAEARMHEAKAKLTELGCEVTGMPPYGVRIEGEQVSDNDLTLLSDLPAVTGINISSPKVTVACLEHIRKLSRLKRLQYNSEHINGQWLAPLRHLPALEKLSIDVASISENEWDGLAQVTRLQELEIEVSPSTECFSAIGQLPQLERLELEYVGIDDAMLKNLKLKSKGDVYLYLSGNPITDAGLEHLKQFTQLESLNIRDTKATRLGLIGLKSALPNCNIDFE